MAARRGVRLGRLLLFGALGAGIGELVTLATEYFTGRALGPVLTVAVAMLGGSLQTAVDSLKDPPTPSSPPQPIPPRPGYRPYGDPRYADPRYADPHPGSRPGYQPYPPYQPPPPRRRGVPIAVALLVLVVVIGGGAYLVSSVIGRVTGNQTGVERLVQPGPSGRAGPLTVTVQGVEVTKDFVKVKVLAINSGDIPITIIMQEGTCQLVGEGGVTLKPYGGFTGLGGGNIDVPERSVPVSKVITFKGDPPGTNLTLSFTTLFAMGPIPNSIQVRNIRLTSA
ncbi:MAG TPA: hypothetical protein VGJ95_14865 [Pseudonocardiaceae bacterium]